MQFPLLGSNILQSTKYFRHLLLVLVITIALSPVALGTESGSGEGADRLISQGYDFLGAGIPAKAEQRFTEALSIDPRSLPAHEGLMWIYHDAGDTEKTLMHADAMRQLAPADPEVLKKWMVVAITVDDRKTEVLATARLLEREHPEHINTLVLHEGLMWIYHDAGDTEKTLMHADAMRQLAPVDLEVLKEWIMVSASIQGRETEVLAAAKQLEKEHPDRINTLAFLGKTLSFSEDYLPQVMQIYEQLLEEDPDNPDALRGLARRAKFDGDLVTALELLERAENAHPLDGRVHSDLEEIRNDAERLRSARVGPTLPIVIAVTVLPLLFGSLILTINVRTYIVMAVYTMTISLASLGWLYLMPLD